MAVIITMSIVLGAELGPKADPTTTTYVPRPEWYFFFLFELLRVIKPPELVPLATIGVPTICMILLFLLPFIDRGPERRPERRPIATIAGIFVIVAMGYLTYLGAAAGSPNSIDMKVAPQVRGGQARRRPVGLPGLPQDRRERQRRPRPAPDRHRRQAARRARSGARSRTRRRRCRRSRGLPEDKKTALVDFLASLKGEDASEPASGGYWRPRTGTLPAESGAGDVRPHRRRLRPHEHGHDGRAAPPLARAGGRPGARRAGHRALDVATGHGRPGDRARARAAARSSARTSPRGCSSGRARRRRA